MCTRRLAKSQPGTRKSITILQIGLPGYKLKNSSRQLPVRGANGHPNSLPHGNMRGENLHPKNLLAKSAAHKSNKGADAIRANGHKNCHKAETGWGETNTKARPCEREWSTRKANGHVLVWLTTCYGYVSIRTDRRPFTSIAECTGNYKLHYCFTSFS